MTNRKIWLSPPHLCGRELDNIQEALAQNWVSPYGENIDVFEQQLESYFKTEDVALVNSGTSAIHLALILAGVQQNNEVVVPTLNFAGCVNPILYQKAIPVFIDSERETYNVDVDRVAEFLSERAKIGKLPKAVIGVHLFGIPCQVEKLRHICASYKIPLIEDAADAIGTTIKGQHVGTFGDFGIISFNGNKVITTSGGGALLAKNRDHISQAKYLRNQSKSEGPHYIHETVGYNYMMSNILAGIGRGQMDVLDERLAKRRDIYEVYKQELSNSTPLHFIDDLPGYNSNRWLSVATFTGKNTALQRDELYKHLHQNNIESRPVWRPMHMQPAYKDFAFTGGNVAEEIFESGICLPSGSSMTDDDLLYVIENIKHFFSKAYMSASRNAEPSTI